MEEMTHNNDAIGDIVATIYLNPVCADIYKVTELENSSGADIIVYDGTEDNEVQANIVVPINNDTAGNIITYDVVCTNDATGNISESDLTNDNEAFANIIRIDEVLNNEACGFIAGVLNNEVCAYILGSPLYSGDVTASISTAIANNDACADIQVATGELPTDVLNLVIGAPNQPGEVTFYDDASDQFVDFKGLVSTTNFKFGYVESTTVVSNSTTDTYDVTDMILYFTLTRTTNIFFFATVAGYNLSAAGNIVMMYLGEGVNQIGPAMFCPGSLNYVSTSPHTHSNIHATCAGTGFIKEVEAGDWQVKLVFSSGQAGTTARITGNIHCLGYIILGA